MMTFEETQALGRVIDHYIHAECDHAQGSGDTSSGHIAHSLMTLDKLRQRLMRDIINSAPPVEEVASRPNGEHPLGQAGPIGIVRDHPSHGEGEASQRPSVIDRGSKEIELRWAKEAIGLVAVELNEAYAKFDTSRDNGLIPTGALCQASRRLEEAMQRLGLTDEIPF